MHCRLFLILAFVIITPSFTVAETELNTGYDLYHNLKLMDDPQSMEDVTAGNFAIGYLKGIFDGIILAQDALYNSMFPSKIMTEKERDMSSKESGFYRLNTPKEGIATGQLILIYNNYAEKYPKKLSGTARLCIWESIVDAYGWK